MITSVWKLILQHRAKNITCYWSYDQFLCGSYNALQLQLGRFHFSHTAFDIINSYRVGIFLQAVPDYASFGLIQSRPAHNYSRCQPKALKQLLAVRNMLFCRVNQWSHAKRAYYSTGSSAEHTNSNFDIGQRSYICRSSGTD